MKMDYHKLLIRRIFTTETSSAQEKTPVLFQNKKRLLFAFFLTVCFYSADSMIQSTDFYGIGQNSAWARGGHGGGDHGGDHGGSGDHGDAGGDHGGDGDHGSGDGSHDGSGDHGGGDGNHDGDGGHGDDNNDHDRDGRNSNHDSGDSHFFSDIGGFIEGLFKE